MYRLRSLFSGQPVLRDASEKFDPGPPLRLDARNGKQHVRRKSAGIRWSVRLATWRSDMEVESKEAAHFRSLEEQLLQPEIRKNSERLGDLLADEFIEFGSSGRTFDKRSVIDRLPQEQRDPEAQSMQWTITEFSARRLAPRVVLVTYRRGTRRDASAEATYSLRSSIWRSTGSKWLMIFLQGTPASRPLLQSN